MTNFIIIFAQKPIQENYASNCVNYGCGGINIDGCRVACDDKAKFLAGVVSKSGAIFGGGEGMYHNRPRGDDARTGGRWPANLIHDGNDEVLALFPVTETHPGVYRKQGGVGNIQFNSSRQLGTIVSTGNKGSAARFFKSFNQ